MNCKSRIICLVMVVVLILMSGCSAIDKVVSIFKDDGSGYIFKASVIGDPKNLDPQLTSDESSIAIARNLFTGLLRLASDGSLVKSGARDYTISSDGLKYTFYLDKRFKWKAAGGYSEPVTAQDYVFAFRRLFDPDTKSPYALDYICIKGARDAIKGKTADEGIGVRALDDYTVEFELEFPNAEFLYLLTKLPASPCSKDFFYDCKGKYGLEADCIASNGPFYVRYWLHDPYGKENYVRLRRNDYYSDISKVYPAGITYLVVKNNAVKLNNFTSGATDVYLSDSIYGLPEDSKRTDHYLNTCGLVINPENKLLSNPDVKLALSQCIDRELLEANTPDYFKSARGLIPTGAYVGGTVYRNAVNEPEIEYNPMLAEYKWSFLLTDNEKLSISGTNILVPDTLEGIDYLKCITDAWRERLHFGVGIEVVTEDVYKERTRNGRYDICLAVIGSDGADACDYLSALGGSDFGFSVPDCNSAVEKVGKYNALTAQIYDISEAESLVVSENIFIPLWYTPTFLVCSDDCEDLELDVFSGAVLFENAKHY